MLYPYAVKGYNTFYPIVYLSVLSCNHFPYKLVMGVLL